MKKSLTAFVLVLAFLMAFISGCSSEKAVDFDMTAAADKIAADHNISGGARYSFANDKYSKLDKDLMSSYFGDAASMPDLSKIASYELYIDETRPTTPCEYGIFELNDEEYGDTLKKFLKHRIEQKLANAKMYPSVQTSMLKSAKFNANGKYVWYCAVSAEGNDEINKFLKERSEGK